MNQSGVAFSSGRKSRGILLDYENAQKQYMEPRKFFSTRALQKVPWNVYYLEKKTGEKHFRYYVCSQAC